MAFLFAMLLLASPAHAQAVNANFSGLISGIPGTLTGANGLGSTLTDATTLANLKNRGFYESRIAADLSTIFANPSNPNYNDVNFSVGNANAAGFKVLLEINYVPTQDQPSSNPCPSTPNRAAPDTTAKLQDYASLAATLVQHLDTTYSGAVIDYEIWNEPDTTPGICAGSGPPYNGSQPAAYQFVYQYVAPAIKSQAASDGFSVNVGGPVLASASHGSAWITPLLSNANTKTHVDFISYHEYVAGPTQITQGYSWIVDSMSPSLWTMTQSSTSGVEAHYASVASLVAAGGQPNASSTAIYVTEYNDNYAFAQDNYRNSLGYSPAWNAVAIADYLDVAYAGYHLPTKLFYFSGRASNGSGPPYFCLVGQVDTNMDCNSSTVTPYPQYYLYEMLARMHLAGGLEPLSLSPSLTTAGIDTAAWLTSDNLFYEVLIINPEPSSASVQVNLALGNGHAISQLGNCYAINAAQESVATFGISWTQTTTIWGPGWTTSVQIPALTVFGVEAIRTH
jgi:hypothetical protein